MRPQLSAVLACIACFLFAPSLFGQQFGTPTYYQVGPNNAGLLGAVAADFNHDGLPDLATIETSYNRIAIALNQGKGKFSGTVKTFSVGAGAPVSIASGDLNGDGIPDLLVVSTGRPNSHLGVYLGKGDGTFTHAANYGLANGPEYVAVADFNGDGKLDVAATNHSHTFVEVFFGNGDGTLQASKHYACLSNGAAIAAADLNHDGHPDLVVAVIRGGVSVLINNGDGTFASPVNYKVGTGPTTIVIADINHDKNQDLVISTQFTQQLAVLLGKGDGTFGKPAFYSTKSIGTGPLGAVVADFNLDGKPDVAVVAQSSGKNGLGVFYGKGDGTFSSAKVTALKFNGGDAVAAADFDGNGAPDVAVTSYFGHTLAVLLNKQ